MACVATVGNSLSLNFITVGGGGGGGGREGLNGEGMSEAWEEGGGGG